MNKETVMVIEQDAVFTGVVKDKFGVRWATYKPGELRIVERTLVDAMESMHSVIVEKNHGD